MEGVSVVTVQFLLSKNGDVGTQEVRDKVSTILADLPDGTEPPIIDKFDTDAMPVMTIAVSGRRDFREVTEIARKQIKERLETVNGVGAVNLVGGRTRAINVVVDTDKLAGVQPLGRRRPAGPGPAEPGGARRPDRPGAARAGPADPGPARHRRRVQRPDRRQPQRLPDPHPRHRPGRGLVRGAADASPGSTATNAVSLVVQKQSGTNTVKVVDDVKARLDELRPALPARHRRPRSSATSRGSSRSRSRR